MQKRFYILFVFIGFFSQLANATEASEIELLATIDADVHADYIQFLNGRNPLEITRYDGEGSRRDVIEVLLLQQALALGGLEQPLKFHIANGYRDSLDTLANGDALLRATPAWMDDCNSDDYHVTKDVIRQGEFQVGLYTRPQYQVTELALPLKTLSAVTNHDLKIDLSTLQQLGVSHIANVEEWPDMVAMVAAGEVDIMLAPFQDTKGMEMIVDKTRLVPITGVKVALADTRHWIVSRAHKQGDQVMAALEKGLALQRKSGTIVRAYTESGFFHPEVKSWALLNSEPQSAHAADKALYLSAL